MEVEKCSVDDKSTSRFMLGVSFWYLLNCYIQQSFGSGGAGYDRFYYILSVSEVKTLEVCIKLRPCCMQFYIQQVVSMV
jgi:hypothetical protein